MPKRPTTAICTLNLLLSLVLLVQGAMPAGYMPASVESGWPVMLCPDGLPEGFLLDSDPVAAHSHHIGYSVGHDQHPPEQVQQTVSHEHDSPTGDDYCPLGSALNASAIVAGFAVADELPQPTADWRLPAITALSGLRLYSAPSRGPPQA